MTWRFSRTHRARAARALLERQERIHADRCAAGRGDRRRAARRRRLARAVQLVRLQRANHAAAAEASRLPKPAADRNARRSEIELKLKITRNAAPSSDRRARRAGRGSSRRTAPLRSAHSRGCRKDDRIAGAHLKQQRLGGTAQGHRVARPITLPTTVIKPT